MNPKIVSVNVGLPRKVEYRGQLVSTGIFKESVSGRVRVHGVGLDGDGQADLRVHGGVDKAVYVYPSQHYVDWQRELGRSLPYGQFGDNLTVSDLTERTARTGDTYRAGTALLQVTGPRLPCYKLGIRMRDMRFLKRFLQSGRTGFYLRVLESGLVEAGDPFELVSRDDSGESIIDIVNGVLEPG